MKNFKKDMFGFAHHAVLGVLVVAVIVFAGVKVLTGIHAAGLQTQTEYFNGASSIAGTPYSSGYQIINDSLGNETVKVALVRAGGYINFGGRGGGSTATPVAQQNCYVMKAPNGAQVQLTGVNGGLVTQTVKPWPYQATPVPYQYSCVTNGVLPKQGPNPVFKVVSGGPVYFYGTEYLVTYPY